MKHSEHPMVSLGDLTEPRVEQTGPKGAAFTYVDIGSIDRDTKRITDPKSLATAKAPSRAKQVLKSGDVLVSMTRPNLNAVALVPQDLDGAVASTGFHVLRARDTEPRYLYYAVQGRSFVEAMSLKVQGALYPAVRPRDIAAFEIPAIGRTEQVRVVEEIESHFTRLESGRDALRRVQANLRRYRAAVLKAACEGRLVPTEAELAKDEGRTFESGEELLARILEERRKNWNGRGKYKEPASLDTTMLGPLPDGWGWSSLGALIISGPQNGVYLPRQLYGRGYPIVRIDDYQDGWVRDADELKRVAASHADAERYGMALGDLVINRVNSPSHLGKCMVVRQTHSGALFESNMMKAQLASDVIPHFVEYYLRSQLGRARLLAGAKWAVNQASINQTDVTRTPLPLPPLAEQTRIVGEVERRLAEVDRMGAVVAANLTRGARFRQSILRAAFEGEG